MNTEVVIWDKADALKRVMGKESILEILVGAFLDDMPPYVDALDSELKKHNFSAAAKSAHTIKGVAGNLSTLKLAHQAKKLELACLEGESADEVLKLQSQLKQVFYMTCDELGLWLKDHA